MRQPSRVRARRSQAGRQRRAQSPVLPTRRRLDACLLLLLGLHVTLFTRRAAEQLVRLLLAQTARRLWLLLLGRGGGLTSTRTDTTGPTARLSLSLAAPSGADPPTLRATGGASPLSRPRRRPMSRQRLSCLVAVRAARRATYRLTAAAPPAAGTADSAAFGPRR